MTTWGNNFYLNLCHWLTAVLAGFKDSAACLWTDLNLMNYLPGLGKCSLIGSPEEEHEIQLLMSLLGISEPCSWICSPAVWLVFVFKMDSVELHHLCLSSLRFILLESYLIKWASQTITMLSCQYLLCTIMRKTILFYCCHLKLCSIHVYKHLCLHLCNCICHHQLRST